MLHRILRFLDDWFALAVLGMYIVAFFVAASMMFIFPQITLLLFFLGLFGLGIAVIVGKTISGLSHSVARHALATGICPDCRRAGAKRFSDDGLWHCEHCDATYDPTGTAILTQPTVGPTAT